VVRICPTLSLPLILIGETVNDQLVLVVVFTVFSDDDSGAWSAGGGDCTTGTFTILIKI